MNLEIKLFKIDEEKLEQIKKELEKK